MIDHYAALYASYQWLVPSRFNIAHMCLHRWTENASQARRPALCVENGGGQAGGAVIWTWQQLSDTARQLSNALLRMGVAPGERVVIAMDQPAPFIAALMAVLGVQAVAVPLSSRLSLSQQRLIMREAQPRTALLDAVSGPALLQGPPLGVGQIVGLGFEHEHIIPWRTLLARQSTSFTPAPTRADAPALLCWPGPDSSTQSHAGRTGQLFAHSALMGALPGVVCAQNWFERPGSAASTPASDPASDLLSAPARPDTLFWTSLDWASAPGLLAGVLPSLYLGHAVFASAVSAIERHTAASPVHDMLARHRVTHLLVEGETLHTLQQGGLSTALAGAAPSSVRSVALHLGPDARLPEHLLTASEEDDQGAIASAVVPNALFSLPHACALIGQSRANWPARSGSVGRVYPGHLAAVLDEKGLPCPAGATGELVVSRYDIQGHPDPAWSLGDWQDGNLHAASPPQTGERLHTGLPARMNPQGDIWLGGQGGA